MTTNQPEKSAALRAAAEALFSDLLAPQPKVRNASKAKKPAMDKLWGSQHSTTKSLIALKTVTPKYQLVSIVHQHCTTCGYDTIYTAVPQIRFEADRRKDGLAIETPFSVPATEFNGIKRYFRHISEDTNLCAYCIPMENPTEVVSPTKQLELFS